MNRHKLAQSLRRFKKLANVSNKEISEILKNSRIIKKEEGTVQLWFDPKSNSWPNALEMIIIFEAVFKDNYEIQPDWEMFLEIMTLDKQTRENVSYIVRSIKDKE